MVYSFVLLRTANVAGASDENSLRLFGKPESLTSSSLSVFNVVKRVMGQVSTVQICDACIRGLAISNPIIIDIPVSDGSD